jgi:hypothetical protein
MAQAYPADVASNASQLSAVQHIVVLMLAGRSFDHMLGFLYSYSGNVSPSGQPFDGLTGSEANPGQEYLRSHRSVVGSAASTGRPGSACHDWPAQSGGEACRTAIWSGRRFGPGAGSGRAAVSSSRIYSAAGHPT